MARGRMVINGAADGAPIVNGGAANDGRGGVPGAAGQLADPGNHGSVAAAAATTAVLAVYQGGANKIQNLMAEQKAMKAAKKKLQKELKAARRRAARLKRKATDLSERD